MTYRRNTIEKGNDVEEEKHKACINNLRKEYD